jgi:hypothetical protein
VGAIVRAPEIAAVRYHALLILRGSTTSPEAKGAAAHLVPVQMLERTDDMG